VKIDPQPLPKDASARGCKWPLTTTFKIGESWSSGGEFFVLRPKEPGTRTRILLQLATNTYNAYSNWGGYSLYAYNGRHKVQGRRVSYDRPIH
jgi:hypothetical protein